MGVIIKPNINVDTITIEKDENDSYGKDQLLGELGKNIPLIKIGEYVLNLGDIVDFNLHCRLNSLPVFSMSVDDSNYRIRENLKADIDKCVIFIGYEHWYIKFNGILNTTYTEAGDTVIELSGTVFNPNLYNTTQKAYKETSIVDILKDVCYTTKMGLFTDDNKDVDIVPNLVMNTGISNIKFIEKTIQQYTKNLWCIDFFYYLHCVNINTLRERSLDKYTLHYETGEKLDSEYDMIFKSVNTDKFKKDNPEEEDNKIPIQYYSIDTNYSNAHIKSQKNNILATVDGDVTVNTTNIGIGDNVENTFSGFKKDNLPFYASVINKSLAGTIIKVKLQNPVLELLPFSVVGFECYLPDVHDTDARSVIFDSEHSGKKIVIDIKFEYNRPIAGSINKNHITQTLQLI